MPPRQDPPPPARLSAAPTAALMPSSKVKIIPI